MIADLGTRIAVAAFLIWPTGSCVPAAPVAPVFNPSEQRAGATQRKWSFYLCHRNQFASPVHHKQDQPTAWTSLSEMGKREITAQVARIGREAKGKG